MGYQGREFYTKLLQKWSDDNDILMYSTHSESESVVCERFIKALRVKQQLIIVCLILVIWTNG